MVRVLARIEPEEFSSVIRSTVPPFPSGIGICTPSMTIRLFEVREVVLIKIPVKRQNNPMRKNNCAGKTQTPRQAATVPSDCRVLYPAAARRPSSSGTMGEACRSTASSNSSGKVSTDLPLVTLRILKYMAVSHRIRSAQFSGISANRAARIKLLRVKANRVIKVSSVKKATPI